MKKGNRLDLIYTTKKGVKIYVSPGRKSEFDFRVRYEEPGKRIRTPKHIHWVIDLCIKREHEKDLTNKLLDFLIDITNKIQPSKKYPPEFQFFSKIDIDEDFSKLDQYGDYTSDFLLATVELIMIQEQTNYPKGTLNKKFLKAFRENKGIFEIAGAATFR